VNEVEHQAHEILTRLPSDFEMALEIVLRAQEMLEERVIKQPSLRSVH
jgi:hypothetical protein